jgi:hypothetical protein
MRGGWAPLRGAVWPCLHDLQQEVSWKAAAEDTSDAKHQGDYPMSSVLRTTVLLAALTALFLVIGGALGGNQGLVIAFVFTLLMNFASY